MTDSEIKMLRKIIAELNNIKTDVSEVKSTLSKISEAVNKLSKEKYEYNTDETVGNCWFCKYVDKPNDSMPCCNCVHGNYEAYKNYFVDAR